MFLQESRECGNEISPSGLRNESVNRLYNLKLSFIFLILSLYLSLAFCCVALGTVVLDLSNLSWFNMIDSNTDRYQKSEKKKCVGWLMKGQILCARTLALKSISLLWKTIENPTERTDDKRIHHNGIFFTAPNFNLIHFCQFHLCASTWS